MMMDPLEECPHCYGNDIGGIVGTDKVVCFDCAQEWNALRPIFDKRNSPEWESYPEEWESNPKRKVPVPKGRWVDDLFSDTRREPKDFHAELWALQPHLEEATYLGDGNFLVDPDAVWEVVSDWEPVEPEYEDGWSVMSPTRCASRAILVSAWVAEPTGVQLSLVDLGRPVVLSYGAGLDSFGMLLAAIERGELPDYVVHMDVGDPTDTDPGEWPGTLRHMEEVVRPLCEAHGIVFHIIDTDEYPVRGARSLFAWLWGDRGPDRPPHHNLQIPVQGPGRICTTVAKVERFERWANDMFPGLEVEVWIGFDATEKTRMDKDPYSIKKPEAIPGRMFRKNRFPLMEWDLCRCRCERLARRLGYPVPRKSACIFCAYGSKPDWQTFARELPDKFAQVAELEAERQKTRTDNGYILSIMGWDAPSFSKPQIATLEALHQDPFAVETLREAATPIRKREYKKAKKAKKAGKKYKMKMPFVITNQTLRVLTDGPEGVDEWPGPLIEYTEEENAEGDVEVNHYLTERGYEKLDELAAAEKPTSVKIGGFTAPPITEWIQGEAEVDEIPCKVCRVPVRATKATGCGYLSEAEYVAAAPKGSW
jgi:hypothetical protein